MNFFHTGESALKKKVSLRGRQDEEKSRDELLSSVRKNREETKQAKLEERSCHKISIAYKRHVIRKKFKTDMRNHMDEVIKSSSFELETLKTLVVDIMYVFNQKYDIARFCNLAKLLIYNMTKMNTKVFSNVVKKQEVNQIVKIITICGEIMGKYDVSGQHTSLLLTLIYLLTLETNFTKFERYLLTSRLDYVGIMDTIAIKTNLITFSRPILKSQSEQQKSLVVQILTRFFKTKSTKVINCIISDIFTLPNILESSDLNLTNQVTSILNQLLVITLPKDNTCHILGNLIHLLFNSKVSMTDSITSLYLQVMNRLIEISPSLLKEKQISSQISFLYSQSHLERLLEHLKSQNTSSSKSDNPFDDSNDSYDAFLHFSTFYSLLSLKSNDIRSQSLIIRIGFSDQVLLSLWEQIQNNLTLEMINTRFSYMLNLFCICFTKRLSYFEDKDIEKPFSIKQLIEISSKLKNIAFSMYWDASKFKNIEIRNSITNLIQLLHEMDSRKTFCPFGHWIVKEAQNFDLFSIKGSDLAPKEQSISRLDVWENFETPDLWNALEYGMREQTSSKTTFLTEKVEKIRQILIFIPFVIPFDMRLQLFDSFLESDHNEVDYMFIPPVEVRRKYLYEDGFSQLFKMNLKGHITVQFRNLDGLLESGVGVGVFKEFVTELSKTAFGSSFGFFTYTKDNMIYPNPGFKVVDPEFTTHFEFLGKILGKAMYEKILVEIPFAKFFISKLLGKNNLLNDLPSLDEELYKNLIFLKNYQGNVADLALTFSVSNNDFGKTSEIELIKGGSKIEVTNENVLTYIYLMAHYRLNIQIRQESLAFLKGVQQMIPQQWLQIFDENELFYIICGSEQMVDLEDMRKNVVLQGYKDSDDTMKHFWSVLGELDKKQRRDFLRFVTSTSRAPLLGFGDLHPPMTIKNTGYDTMERLPTTSTCINLLKLPPYDSKEVLREKLLMAIEQGITSFELS